MAKKKKKSNIISEIGLDGKVKAYNSNTFAGEVGKNGTISDYDYEDVAPVKKTTTTSKKEEEKERSWFESGAFSDGYQFGDLTKTILGSGTDLVENAGAGLLGMGEKGVDALAYIAPAFELGQKAQNGFLTQEDFDRNKEAKEDMQDFIQKDLYDEEKVAKAIISNPVKSVTGIDSETMSVFGEKTDALAQSGGQLLGTMGLNAVGVPWFLTTGVTSFGGEVENALEQGATYEEAGGSALITAGAEILTEKLSGGISFGGKTLDDVWLKPLTEQITNKTIRTATKLGFDALGEGGEEVLTEMISNLGTKLYKEENVGELLFSEEALDGYIESFIGGAVLGGGVSSVNAIKTNKSGKDYVTGLTENETKVVDKEIENRVAEREADGTKLTSKEKYEIREQVINDLDKGYLNLDTIESVLGGETYESYKSSIDKEKSLREEITKLQSDPRPQAQNKLSELKAELSELTKNDANAKLKDQLSREVQELTKSERLGESYNEKSRKTQKFEADLSKYDAKTQEVIKKATESGILNNTNRTHEFVDMVAKLSADKGVSFDFTNNENLKKSGFALEGKTINGLVKDNDIILNIDSSKALNTVVGHEITHVLEGTELYTELQNVVKQYATTKGEYETRYKAIQELYKDVEGANIDNEITADLVGEYLFTDSDFINNLSTTKPSVFKKIYDEIKYLYKVATAGSKEARELEKVKRAFDKAYKESGKANDTTKYSVSDKNIKDVSTGYSSGETFFTMSYMQNGKEVGTLEYGEYNGEPSVKMVEVTPEYRRKGIGTKLLQELQKKYPDAEIDFGMTTPDGTKLLEQSTYTVENTEVTEKLARIEEIQAKLTEYDKGYENYFENDLEIPENYAEDYNDLHDEMVQLQKEINGKKRTKTFVKYSLTADTKGRSLTKEQAEYFKDSAVRDENGNLKVMYHGTSAGGHTVFDPYGKAKYGLFGTGTYFTDDPSVAESYTEKGRGNNKQVYETYLNIKNPIDMDAQGDYEAWKKALPDAHFPKEGTNEDYYRAMEEYFEDNEYSKAEASETAMEVIESMGYDGITHVGGGRFNKADETRHRVYIAFSSEQIKNVDNTKPTTDADIRYSLSEDSLKQKQLDIVLESNPVHDDYHTWIRSKDDILTFEEALNSDDYVDYKGEDFDPSYPYSIVEEALETGKITVYSSYPIGQGVFVSPSRMEAESYSGNGKVYSKEVSLTDIAWIDPTQGQYAKVDTDSQYSLGDQVAPIGNYNVYGKDIAFETAPVEETVQEVADEYAPITNASEIDAQQNDRLYSLNESEIPDEVENPRQLKLDTETGEIVEEDLQTRTRKEIKKALLEKDNTDIVKALDNAKNIPMALMNNTDTIRVTEMVFGRETGRKINDLIFQKAINNEAKSIRWQNKERADIKELGIKAGSKESEAVQKYGEGEYVNENGERIIYDDKALAKEFADAKTRAKIIKASKVIRKKYDNYIELANNTLTSLGFDPIPKRKDYFRHFQELNDTFTRYGIPFNAQNMQEHVLPTDINGLTEFWSPQKNYFANAQPRKGLKTTYDAIQGVDGYLSGISNLIFHTEDIQRGRAFEDLIRNTYGQDSDIANFDNMTPEQQQERIKKIQDNHLSNYSAWVHEWTNNIAGKKNKVDRAVESVFGRKAFAFLDETRKQVGANMIGFNVSSSLTNGVASVQAIAKTNKLAVLKGTGDTVKNIFVKDNFAEKNDFLASRMGTEMISKKPWEKMRDAGFIFMKGMDWFTSNQIVRSKYYELRSKGMSEEQAHAEAGQFASRIMGDRTKGAMPQIYTSKLLGLATQFQLEVNNQLYSMFYDTYHESKESAKDNALLTTAKMTFTLGQLFAYTHVFGKTFESIAGYNPTFDVIGIIATALGLGDDDDEKTTQERLKESADMLVDALPYVNILTGGGRIPVASGIPNLVGVATGGKDEYGNELTLEDELKKLLYLVPPTGGNQIKKTTQGLGMFSDEHPVSGSYTDSGNLRFPVEETPLNVLQAGLFGQWANENARQYFDEERSPLKSKQIQEFTDLDISIQEYWEYRDGLKELKTVEEKFDYIAGLDFPVSKKNIMINNIVDRKEEVDLTGYEDFGSYEEFDFATSNAEKYDFLQANDISYADYSASDESKEAYNWAYKNPEKYEVAKAVTDDIVTYRQYAGELNDIRADKDENGNSISGSAKEKKLDYINSLDIDYGAKLVLFKSEYNADDTYNYEIIEYLNSRNDISYSQMETILKELGFTIDTNGNIYWD